MRVPARFHITWADENTLKIEADAGTQTRLLPFGSARPAKNSTWQGDSVAEWERARTAERPTSNPGGGEPWAGFVGPLRVVTSNMRPGYLQKNGVPYSGNAVVTEYFDKLEPEDNGDEWLLVTTLVDDPQYLMVPFMRSTHFKKERDGSKWRPTPCTAR